MARNTANSMAAAEDAAAAPAPGINTPNVTISVMDSFIPHKILKKIIIPDDIDKIKKTIELLSNNPLIDCIISTGGTGLTGRDSTPEAILALSHKIIDGFGELFRQLSYNIIGTSTIQSRAIAAVINHTYIFALPGSPGACKDGWDSILQYQLDIRHKPCNFIEIMPRLKEK